MTIYYGNYILWKQGRIHSNVDPSKPKSRLTTDRQSDWKSTCLKPSQVIPSWERLSYSHSLEKVAIDHVHTISLEEVMNSRIFRCSLESLWKERVLGPSVGNVWHVCLSSESAFLADTWSLQNNDFQELRVRKRLTFAKVFARSRRTYQNLSKRSKHPRLKEITLAKKMEMSLIMNWLLLIPQLKRLGMYM